VRFHPAGLIVCPRFLNAFDIFGGRIRQQIFQEDITVLLFHGFDSADDFCRDKLTLMAFSIRKILLRYPQIGIDNRPVFENDKLNILKYQQVSSLPIYSPNFSLARLRKVWGLSFRRRAAASRLPSFLRMASS